MSCGSSTPGGRASSSSAPASTTFSSPARRRRRRPAAACGARRAPARDPRAPHSTQIGLPGVLPARSTRTDAACGVLRPCARRPRTIRHAAGGAVERATARRPGSDARRGRSSASTPWRARARVAGRSPAVNQLRIPPGGRALPSPVKLAAPLRVALTAPPRPATGAAIAARTSLAAPPSTGGNVMAKRFKPTPLTDLSSARSAAARSRTSPNAPSRSCAQATAGSGGSLHADTPDSAACRSEISAWSCSRIRRRPTSPGSAPGCVSVTSWRRAAAARSGSGRHARRARRRCRRGVTPAPTPPSGPRRTSASRPSSPRIRLSRSRRRRSPRR